MHFFRVISSFQDGTSKRKQAEEASTVSVVALSAVQSAAALAINKKTKEAKELLHATSIMLRRGAITDEQQEEYGNFVQWSSEVEGMIGAANSDDATSTFFRMRNANLNMFLSASSKLLTDRMIVNKELQKQYYANKY